MQEEVEMWNGGSTGRVRKDDGVLIDDITDTPYDESKIMDSKGIIYDGMMGEIQDDNG